MKTVLLLLLLTSSISFAEFQPPSTTGCASPAQVHNDVVASTVAVKAAITAGQFATKADLTAAVTKLQAAIAAITTITPTPQPTPTPTPVATGGVFIGSTEYPTIAAAGAAYNSGDTIRITKSLDNDSTVLNRGDVTIVCDPGVKLTWSAGVGKRVSWGKGIFDVEAPTNNFTIRGCEISGAVLNGPDGGNASAVRLNDSALTATFDSVNFHDCNDGILGGAKTVTITNSRFDHNGVNSGGYANVHNIYISQYADQLNVSNTYFGHVTPAHLFKSRAANTTVTSSQFETSADFDGSYLIDIPNGGNVLVTKSVFVKAPGQSQRGMFAFGEEGLIAGRTDKWEFANNIVINDGNGRLLNQSGGVMNWHDNKIAGAGMDGIEPLQAGANNQFFNSRSDAGLPSSGIPQALTK